jgi:hypothetical protein
MMSGTSIVVIIACFIVMLLIAGCTQQPAQTTVQTTVVPVPVTQPAVTTAPASAGMANPASVNCGNVGGTTEIKSNPDGSQYGMCTFPNGSTCEEWALYRNEGCKPNVYVAPTTVTTNASQS